MSFCATLERGVVCPFGAHCRQRHPPKPINSLLWGLVWQANPQFYDYEHSLGFHKPSGRVTLSDGGGQCMSMISDAIAYDHSIVPEDRHIKNTARRRQDSHV